ncbi:hypothetical protein HZS_6318 [Henneguya salminicola]|nr:hypothetical protein HZS_6318 [Henneguya salminicola]
MYRGFDNELICYILFNQMQYTLSSPSHTKLDIKILNSMMVQKMREKVLFSLSHRFNLIFLAVAPISTLIQPFIFGQMEINNEIIYRRVRAKVRENV